MSRAPDRERPGQHGSSLARARLVDGGLAAVALLSVVATGIAFGVAARPLALGVGVVGALIVEAGLQHRRDGVRAAWARREVKLAALGAFVAALALAVAVSPPLGLSLLAGGLVGYLALLTGVAVGTVLRDRR